MIIDLTLKVEETLIDDFLKEQEDKWLAQGHIGTHLDTYQKTEIPLAYFRRRGILIDASSYSEKREIEYSDIDWNFVKEGDFVLIQTGRLERESYGTPAYFSNHPVLSDELIQGFINKKVSFIGIDAPGIRQNESHRLADVLCEKSGIYVIENLANLNQIACDQFIVYTMWLDDAKATGLKTRVIVETSELTL